MTADAQTGRCGTLRFITPAKIKAAAALVQEGLVIPLNRPLTARHPSRPAPQHHLLEHHSLRQMPDGRVGVVNDDRIEISMQGSSHWDALAHFGVIDGSGSAIYYGGATLGETSLAGPARTLGIDTMSGGVVGRGVLLDLVAAAAGPEAAYLPPTERVGAAAIERCLAQQAVTLRAGDIVLLYTGFERLVADNGGRFPAAAPGIDASTVPIFSSADVAAVAADNPGVEAVPADFLVHAACLRDEGLPLGELWSLDELAETCRRLQRYEFLLVSVPLHFPGAYGSPANAVAVL